ncbi:MAG: hypothetical protein QOK10_1508 [Pseudonocardiales bacterium]|jgi:hypothetical protein|nr:hypothetical protein [Pseudonocardiales bacterium]
MTESNDDGIRIGTAEREAAIAALGDHLEAGRLDLDEYADRSALASVARTRIELLNLFTDLPGPRPWFDPQPAVADGRWRPASMEMPRGRRSDGLRPLRAARLLPILVLVMVIALHLWVLFLLIPLSGLVLRNRYGARPRYRRWCGPSLR